MSVTLCLAWYCKTIYLYYSKIGSVCYIHVLSGGLGALPPGNFRILEVLRSHFTVLLKGVAILVAQKEINYCFIRY